jgi:hypothetical protein
MRWRLSAAIKDETMYANMDRGLDVVLMFGPH